MVNLPIVHHPAYDAEFPADHRFPMGKFARLAEILIENGLAAPGTFHVPSPAPRDWVCLAHAPAYVDQVFAASVPDRIASEIGFPINEKVALRARCATAGTVLTARLALQYGIACNTAGGSHHARPDQGAGFCVFNDVAVAAHVLLAAGQIGTALVFDCDVHQGDGTAAIFAGDARVRTVSLHCEKNYPVRKVMSDLDVPLADGMEDREYLDILDRALQRSLDSFDPDIVFFNAGVDVHRDDRLGRLCLSEEGIAKRESRVIGFFRDRHIPLAGVLGGGYSRDINQLARRHSILHRTASRFIE